MFGAINTALAGMQRHQEAFARHADRIARWGLPTDAGDGTGTAGDIDLATELTGVLTSRRGYEANLAVVRAADDMLGSLLDVLA
jgi:flagellar hook protein FlgE